MTEHHKRSVSNSKITGAVLFCAALGLVLLAARYEQRHNTGPRQAQTAIVSDSQSIGIPHGRQEFTVSTNAKNGPRMSGGFIDPMDPARGERQTISLRVSDSEPVTSVMATVTFDTTSRKFPLRLASGTPQDGVWMGTWPVNDTYRESYFIGLSAQSKRGTSKIDIVLR
jgi:hypothetical protein